MTMDTLSVIDSHTAGEPTRVVVSPLDVLAGQSAAQRRDTLRTQLDWIRSSLILEPRGSDVMVGAVLGPSILDDCIASVVFFNNIGYLGMCGHGLIGVMATLAFQGTIGPGTYKLETPVGIVVASLLDDGRVQFDNVPAYQHRSAVSIEVPGYGRVVGDIAWGGNWFFLSGDLPIAIHWDHRNALTQYAMAVRDAVRGQGITGAGGAEIDHFEFFSPSASDEADVDNFVLCPGAAFDRSPCGTGTSAKLATLAASGKLKPGQIWRQRSITGGVFTGWYKRLDSQQITPTICGQAFVNATSQIILNPSDPLAHGLQAAEPLH